MSLLDKVGAILNRSPADVMMEQMRKLYMRLYPYMANDFAHIQDIEKTIVQLNSQIGRAHV